MLSWSRRFTGDVTIVGGWSTTIRHSPAVATFFRIFDVGAGATLRARSFFILDGIVVGGIGGGILDAGAVFLDHVTLSGNVASSLGPGGGAIAVTAGARAVINASLLNNNRDDTGGAITNAGDLTLTESRVTGNRAGPGGGIDVNGGTTRIVRSTIDHNVSSGDGGGIIIRNNGSVSLVRSLITRNHAAGTGGGVFNMSGSITAQDSIIRANTPDNCVPANIPGCAA